jgi:hypothetical protein
VLKKPKTAGAEAQMIFKRFACRGIIQTIMRMNLSLFVFGQGDFFIYTKSSRQHD